MYIVSDSGALLKADKQCIMRIKNWELKNIKLRQMYQIKNNRAGLYLVNIPRS